MKIRSDFVTNSSSSSFIIQKSDKFNTEEDVFKFIQKPYKQQLDRLEAAKVYAAKIGHPLVEGYCGSWKFQDESVMDHSTVLKYRRMVLEHSKFDMYDYLDTDYAQTLLQYDSYKEYVSAYPQGKFFTNLEDLTAYDRDEIIEWYSDSEWCPKYFIADENELPKVLQNCFLIYDREGGPYHFHDIAEELSKECLRCCTHMG